MTRFTKVRALDETGVEARAPPGPGPPGRAAVLMNSFLGRWASLPVQDRESSHAPQQSLRFSTVVRRCTFCYARPLRSGCQSRMDVSYMWADNSELFVSVLRVAVLLGEHASLYPTAAAVFSVATASRAVPLCRRSILAPRECLPRLEPVQRVLPGAVHDAVPSRLGP